MWLLACHGEYSNFRVSLEVWGETRCNVLRVHLRLKVGCCVLLAVEAVKNLDVLVAHEHLLARRTLDGVEGWLAVADEYSLTGAFAHEDYMLYLLRLFLIRVQRGGERHDSPKLYVTSIANRTFVRFRQFVEQNFKTVPTEMSGWLSHSE